MAAPQTVDQLAASIRDNADKLTCIQTPALFSACPLYTEQTTGLVTIAMCGVVDKHVWLLAMTLLM